MTEAPYFAFAIYANTEEQLHALLIQIARGMDDPDRIKAIRLGDTSAQVDVLTAPLAPKQLH